MGRQNISDPRVQTIIQRLVAQFLTLGSLSALTRALNNARVPSSPKIYPNRLHGLLSEDESRSISSDVVEAIDQSLAVLESGAGRQDNTIRHRVMAALGQVPGGTCQIGRAHV